MGICVACSDVHRAAGAHGSCVKNFSTYLWGPDEVALMRAVGNKRGIELYGEATVLPSDSKGVTVDACTKKYGCSEVQLIMKNQIAAATAEALEGPKLVANEQPGPAAVAGPRVRAAETQSASPSVESRVNVGPTSVQRGAKATVLAPSKLDLFDSLFGIDQEFSKQPASTPILQTQVHVPPAQADLDIFISPCRSEPGSVASRTKHGAALADSGLDDSIFANFGKW